jgi:hypothetical protein
MQWSEFKKRAASFTFRNSPSAFSDEQLVLDSRSRVRPAEQVNRKFQALLGDQPTALRQGSLNHR